MAECNDSVARFELEILRQQIEQQENTIDALIDAYREIIDTLDTLGVALTQAASTMDKIREYIDGETDGSESE